MRMLQGNAAALAAAYDVAMLDLDGVVYVGGRAVPQAPEALAAAREAGLRLAFITNNASRPPEVVAEHLTELGVPAVAADVVNSAQAAARVLRDRLGEGARVAMLGTTGLEAALAEEGLTAVAVDAPAEAVVTGYGPEVPWRDLMRAAVRIRDGLWWVASNTDMTIPTDYGIAPGHGVLVEMVQRFSGVEPVVAGKPERPLLDETVRRMSAEQPLMVGDRLDTDIAGAVRSDLPSLLVMTGVTDVADLAAAPPELRPTYLAADLRGLLEPCVEAVPAVATDGRASSGGWTATAADGAVTVTGDGEPSAWWRAVAGAAWWWLDEAGSAADVSGLTPPGR
jgi:glycerol-1-phosphatase